MDALLDLTGEIILITGGAGAIGRVIVPVLAAHGAKVAVNDVLPEGEAKRLLPLDRSEAGTAGEIAQNVAYFEADGTQPEEVALLYEQVIEQWGMPTIVCCHAGMVEVAPVAEFPLDGYDRVMNLNLRAAFIVAQRAAQLWQAAGSPPGAGGHLIFTSSWVQDVPWPEITPYNVSKSGLRTLMRGFARELAPRIRANAVAPGIVGVGMARRQWDTDASYRARAGKAIPLGELQTPESVAHAFLFLCSRMASYMTGSVLLVDGGCSLYPMD